MERHEPAFPWIPEYDREFVPSGVSDDLGLIGSGLVAIANLVSSSLELYLFFFFTHLVTGLFIIQ